jgi:hypothetical protein
MGARTLNSPLRSFSRLSSGLGKEGHLEDKIMIETSEQLYQAIEQMGRMQRILESYRNEILAKNPRNFALLAEGPLEQLRQLQKQIDEYIQGLEAGGTPAGS